MTQKSTVDKNGIFKSEKRYRTIKTIMLLLFVFSFFSLFLGVRLLSLTATANRPLTEKMWLLFLPLPIPLASLILGIFYRKRGFKTTKNIVVGVIFATLLLLFGSSTCIFRDMYSHDFSYVNRVEELIDFDMPNQGDISTLDMISETQTKLEANTVQYLYMSDILFTDEVEIAEFNTAIADSDLWQTSVNTSSMGLIPPMYSHLPSSTQYNYFMVYNVDKRIYNAIPDNSGTYTFFFIAYNSMDGTMKIGEYILTVLV